MADYITKLPDHILCSITSLLTARDSFRVKSLSSAWKNLPADCRSILQFDSHTIFGKDPSCFPYFPNRSKFIKAVDQFLQIWRAQKTSAFIVNFGLQNEHASHIDRWISIVATKGVEELDLDFSSYLTTVENYVFPCHLMGHTHEMGPCLKRLRLKYCDMTSLSDVPSNWLTNLTSIELERVSLRPGDLQCILSSTLNLESLSLASCGLNGYIFIQHRSMKKLVIDQTSSCIQLSCPNLEIFKFTSRTDFIFSQINSLREATMNLYYEVKGSSQVFSNLATNAPQLQTLSLWVTTEVPPLPSSLTMSSLKRLDLLTFAPRGFDHLTITHMLHACPVLEALYLKVKPTTYSIKQSPKEYEDRLHYHLKEVKIEGLTPGMLMIELVVYLLKNCVSLKQMVFVVGAEHSHIVTRSSKFRKWQNINPNAKLIVI